MRDSIAVRLLVRSATAVLAVITIAGGSLLVPTSPWVVRALVDDPSLSRRTGLGRDESLALAESTRRYVLGADPTLDPRYGPREAEHLRDVRSVIRRRWWALPSAITLACLAFAMRRRRRELAAGLVWAGAGLLTALVACVIAGLADFDALFGAFHGLFFAEGTWAFPADALVIAVFPLRFWVADGALWGGTAIALVAATLASGLLLGARRSAREA